MRAWCGTWPPADEAGGTIPRQYLLDDLAESFVRTPGNKLMSPSISRGWRLRSILFGIGLLYLLPPGTPQAEAQAPVLTDPGDVRVVSVNTGLRPLESNPVWSSAAPMPTERTGFAIGSLDGKIYAIGGATVHDCITVPVVEAYQADADRWITGLAPLPAPGRYRASAGALGNLIYIVGGESSEGTCPGEPIGNLQAYDPATDTWSEKPPLPTPRRELGAGVDPLRNILYTVGGAAEDLTALDIVEVFDPAANGGTGSWATKAPLITPRGNPAVAAVNGKIYAIGGQEQDPVLVAIDTVEEFDPDANGGFGAWTLKNGRMPHPRIGSSFAVLGDKIYIIGGQEIRGAGIVGTVDVYDPASDNWTTIVSMPTARRQIGAAAAGDTIYALGGESRVATVGEQFTYQITATNHPTYYDAAPLPEGLQIDHQRGIIYGQPAISSQLFVVTLTASNPSGTDSIDVSFLITIPPPPENELPSIDSGICVTGRAGQPFRFPIMTHNAVVGNLLQATGLPYATGKGPEIILDPATNVISGLVPPSFDGSAQSYGVGLNIMQADVAQSFLQLTFVSDPLFPVITSDSVATLVLNQFFSYTITADAPVSSFSYLGEDGVLNGLLPSGLTFDPTTGTISGIFTDPGGGSPGPNTIKKEPPPKIRLLGLTNGIGTGTLPLTFVTGCHDFEIETLKTTPSAEASYLIVTDDPVNSGFGAGLLQSATIGDSTSFSVPVAFPGTYAVRVGFRADQGQGIFQLAIDGTNRGPSLDEYSPTKSYEVADLGAVTFSEAGEHTFSFSFVGQNPAATGSDLVFDFIDLVPHFEVEALPVHDQTAGTRVVRDSRLSGGAGVLVRAGDRGAYVTYNMAVTTPGIYDVLVKTAGTRHAGNFELFIDGIPQGYPQTDIPALGVVKDGLHDLGRVIFQSAGEKAFKFVVTSGARGSGTGEVLLDDIELVLTSHFEAESITAVGTQEVRTVPDPNLSGGAGIQFRGKKAGDYVTCTVPVPVGGTYEVKYGVRKKRHNGVVQLLINGENHGAARDTYSPDRQCEVIDLGRVTFQEAGNASFQFVITDRNLNSLGYDFDLDYIELNR